MKGFNCSEDGYDEIQEIIHKFDDLAQRYGLRDWINFQQQDFLDIDEYFKVDQEEKFSRECIDAINTFPI